MKPPYTAEQVVRLLVAEQGEGTQTDLARRIGVTPQYISRVLSGESTPGPSVLQFLGLEVGYIRKSERAA